MNANNAVSEGEFQLSLPFSAPEPLLSIKDAARAMRLRYWLLLRAVKRGDIPTYQIGSTRRRVRLSDIEAVIQASRR